MRKFWMLSKNGARLLFVFPPVCLHFLNAFMAFFCSWQQFRGPNSRRDWASVGTEPS
jgi:hypothetical protein